MEFWAWLLKSHRFRSHTKCGLPGNKITYFTVPRLSSWKEGVCGVKNEVSVRMGQSIFSLDPLYNLNPGSAPGHGSLAHDSFFMAGRKQWGQKLSKYIQDIYEGNTLASILRLLKIYWLMQWKLQELQFPRRFPNLGSGSGAPERRWNTSTGRPRGRCSSFGGGGVVLPKLSSDTKGNKKPRFVS